jgi:hypothetical protein
MKARKPWGWLVLFLALLATTAEARGEPTRKLLYPAEVKGQLAEVVAELRDPGRPVVADRDLKASRYFARLAPRAHLLDGAALKKGAWLGPRPFVFLTAPESFYGKGLLQVYGDVGYSADSVLGQFGREMVVIVFRYPESVALHPGTDGELPRDWSRRAYVPTWPNACALFERLARKADLDGVGPRPFTPERLLLRDERERGFICSFPEAGRKRLQRSSYQALRETEGADWEYRSLLERHLGMSEHFTGTGRTRPTLGRDGGGRLGLPEWLGPNLRLDSLAEMAIVDFGAVRLGK